MDAKEVESLCIGLTSPKRVCKMNFSQAMFLCKTASQVKDDGTILEIGCHRGGSLVLMAVSSKKKVKIFSIDKKKLDCVEILLNQYNVRNKCEVIIADSHKYKWSSNIFIDLLLIDGDHSYKGCLLDLKMYCSHVKQSGFIFVHDYPSKGVKEYENRQHFFNDNMKKNRRVKKAVRRFISKNRNFYPKSSLDGLLLIQKIL